MTINEIRSKQFDLVKRGYDPDEVRMYLDQICGQLQTLEADKLNLMKKLEVLARKVEEYKKDEESIQEALLGAQKLAKTTLSEAQEKADKVTRESKEQAEKLLSVAKSESQKMDAEAKMQAQELLLKAKSESEKMLSDAKVTVDTTLRNSRYEIEKEHTTLLRTQKEVSRFKKELLDIYRNHIDLIQKLPDTEPDKVDKEKEARELQKNIYKQKAEEPKMTAESEDVLGVSMTSDTAELTQDLPAQNVPDSTAVFQKESALDEANVPQNMTLEPQKEQNIPMDDLSRQEAARSARNVPPADMNPSAPGTGTLPAQTPPQQAPVFEQNPLQKTQIFDQNPQAQTARTTATNLGTIQKEQNKPQEPKGEKPYVNKFGELKFGGHAK